MLKSLAVARLLKQAFYASTVKEKDLFALIHTCSKKPKFGLDDLK